MSMHTPEPWTWGWEDPSVIYIRGPHELEDHVLWSGICKACQKTGSRCTAPSDANANRIVACVNALAGIEDPAAYMEALKEARSVLSEILSDDCVSFASGDRGEAVLEKLDQLTAPRDRGVTHSRHTGSHNGTQPATGADNDRDYKEA